MTEHGRDEFLLSIEALKRRVEEMAPGDNLEALIDEGLGELDRALVRYLLNARDRAAHRQEGGAFPPSAVPALRRKRRPAPGRA